MSDGKNDIGIAGSLCVKYSKEGENSLTNRWGSRRDYSYGTGSYSVHYRGGCMGAPASGFHAEVQAGICLLYPIHAAPVQLRIGSRNTVKTIMSS